MSLTKHRTLMISPDVIGALVFFYKVNDDNEVEGQFSFEKSLWEDMGSPQTITLSVEPGDLLNV